MIARVGSMLCARAALVVVVFPSDLRAHAGAGFGVLGMVRPSCCRRATGFGSGWV
jgi:hypothetical protein